MTRLVLILCLLACPAIADDGESLAERVATACGVDAWSNVERVAFTWSHHPSGNDRSYAWTPADHAVTMSFRDRTVTIDTQAVESEDERQAHSAFVNDHYWMMFELRLAWDEGVEFTDLGERAVPGFDDLGKRRALRVHYTGDGGYTPGDAYVLYLGDDLRPVAWAFHRGGAEQPSLVTTREGWTSAAGLHFPTRFRTSDGETFISITDVAVETRSS